MGTDIVFGGMACQAKVFTNQTECVWFNYISASSRKLFKINSLSHCSKNNRGYSN